MYRLFYILRAMKIVQTFSRPKQGNSAGAHAPYFRTLRSITGGKASTTHRHSAPCTLFTDCNAPTNYCYLWLISSNTVSLLIKVSGVRISDGSPKKNPTATTVVTAGFFHFLRALSKGERKAKLTTVFEGIKCTYFLTISSEV